MKIHRSVTEKAIEANRRNAKKSTGPTNEEGKLAVRHNAVRHGLLAKQIIFRHSKEKQDEFKELLNDLESHFMPMDILEKMLVEEIGACWWKLQRATRLELKGFQNQRAASEQVVAKLHDANAPLDLLDYDFDTHSLPHWECGTLIIRSSKGSDDTDGTDKPLISALPYAPARSSHATHESGHTEIQAILNSSLPTILRYQTTLKRDFYKAIQALQDMQRQRKERRKERDLKKRHRHP